MKSHRDEHKNPLNNYDLHDDQCSESHVYLRALMIVYPIFYIFSRLERTLDAGGVHKYLSTTACFVKICGQKGTQKFIVVCIWQKLVG